MSGNLKRIAILTGGPSAERGIALASARFVAQHLDPLKYLSKTILLEPNGWIEQETGQSVDLNDFSLKEGLDTVSFDFVFLIIHGTPAEDGKIQGYFEAQKIPYSTCDTLTSALTFNKQWCKDFLKNFSVPMAWSIVIDSGKIAGIDVKTLKYPVFVKPNNNGSSYGVSRVNSSDKLHAALEQAAQYDHEIIIEAFIEGREFSCGVLREGTQIHVFPITEIIPKNEFFDYQAKYEGASQEVTPAQLDTHLSTQCQEQSRKIYEILKCRGLVRCDYILRDGTFYMLEVNTIPGLSPASIVPQQARAYGWSMEHMLDVVIQDCSGK
jgi:D-alanine-D-alanine ligase